MIAVEIFVDGSCETSFCPTSGWETSIPVNHVTPGLVSGVDDLDVAKTWLLGLVEYSVRSEAPSPRVAPKMRILGILEYFKTIDVERERETPGVALFRTARHWRIKNDVTNGKSS